VKTRIPRKQWALPAGLNTNTGQAATLKDVCDPAVPTASFAGLTRRRQADIVATRILKQKRFRLWRLGGPAALISKRRAVEAVRTQTPLGNVLIRVEQHLIAMIEEEAARRLVVRKGAARGSHRRR
jgi:hypothetical protein